MSNADIRCPGCKQSFKREELKKNCSNCFACTGCEVYICYKCGTRIEIKPPGKIKKRHPQ